MTPFFVPVLLGEAAVQLRGPLDEGAALHADQPQVGPGLRQHKVHEAGAHRTTTLVILSLLVVVTDSGVGLLGLVLL